LASWARRFIILDQLKKLCEDYKQQRKEFFEVNAGETDSLQWQQFKTRDNLVKTFMDPTLSAPTAWWTNAHDVGLVRGVYKYGYGNH
jgi:hypothetical protein